MTVHSFNDPKEFDDDRIVTQVILETPFSKEIRILLKKGQMMKKHSAPLPIIVHLLEGEIDFGVEDKFHALRKGDILSLAANIPHDLTARKDSIVRLTISKQDSIDRVNDAAKE